MKGTQTTEGKPPEAGRLIVQLPALGYTARLFLLPMIRCLQGQGHEVVLVCSPGPEAEFAARETGIRHIPVHISQGISPLSDLVSLWRLWRLFRRMRPDVVHTHCSKAGLVGTLAAWMARVPVRIYQNHGLPMLSYHGLKRGLFGAAERLTAQVATHVVFVSESTRKLSVDSNAKLAAKSVVLCNGVDVTRFSRDPTGQRRTHQRQAWGVTDETVVVGFVGRINRQKGIGELLEAWRELEPSLRSRARLVLVGDFAEDESRGLVKQAIAHGLGVLHAGWMEDTVPAYEAFDIMVLPSWHEGMPVCLLEAQSMGLPVITTDALGCVDAVEPGGTAIVVPVRETAALAKALRLLMTSPRLRAELGTNGRQRAVSRFSQEVAKRSIDFLYQETLRPAMGAMPRALAGAPRCCRPSQVEVTNGDNIYK